MNIHKKQSGAALILAMVILLVLTIFGITAMTVSRTQDRIVANMQDRLIADDCADTVIRQVQADLVNNRITTDSGDALNINSDADEQVITSTTAASSGCANTVAVTFEYAGRSIVEGSVDSCYAALYEINVTVDLNTGSQSSAAMAVALNPASCI